MLLSIARTLYILPAVTVFYHPMVCQLSSHHHLPVLAVLLPITRQRRLCCLLAHRDILSYYPSWYALNGSNSSCLLLGGMSSQQNITPQKNMSRNPRIGFPFSPPLDHTLFYFWPMTHHSCIGWIQVSSAWALRLLHFLCTLKAYLLLMRLP